MPEIIVHETGGNIKVAANGLGAPLHQILCRAPEILFRRGQQLLQDFLRSAQRKDGSVWVVQGGYDVEVLRKSCPNIDFHNVWSQEIAIANNCFPADVEPIRRIILQLTGDFCEGWLPRYRVWLEWLVESYLDNVVSRLQAVEAGIKQRMEAEGPQAILYSIGSENVLEEAIARVANGQNIPVYYFKHGGAENLFLLPSILDPYLERNQVIRRTQFLHSSVELHDYEKSPDIHPVVTGALLRPSFPSVDIGGRKILYSAGAPAHYTFKEMRKIISDRERYIFAKSLVEKCAALDLYLDVKIHPAEWSVGYTFFRALCDRLESRGKRIRILSGGTIERNLSLYSLLVLDMVSTKVLSSAFNLDLPIVLYVPSGFPMRPEHYDDLKKRVHVVQNADELNNVLNLHANGNLKNSYGEEFKGKYMGTSNINDALYKVKKVMRDNGLGITV
ncbi:MAG: hypothetical protein OEY01_06630 [Desulfobulbaceae bacterium]|nr:hypothetical protein [Desulfobulbaceae bacterium]